jgi:hypothetical protein
MYDYTNDDIFAGVEMGESKARSAIKRGFASLKKQIPQSFSMTANGKTIDVSKQGINISDVPPPPDPMEFLKKYGIYIAAGAVLIFILKKGKK